MGLVYKDRVKETSTTTGTDAYVLDGAESGFQPFAAIGDTKMCGYCATNNVDWEVGIGTYDAGTNTLARTRILDSSNGGFGAAVSWTAGTRTLFCTLPAGTTPLLTPAVTASTNSVSNDEATVGGGQANIASGEASTIAGGDSNTAIEQASFIGGGNSNTAAGDASFIGGGGSNSLTSNGVLAVIGGGDTNSIDSAYSAICGGSNNTIADTADYSTIGGGQTNAIATGANTATIGGGNSNTASGTQSTIGGGTGHTASGPQSTIGGGNANTASGTSSSVGGGATNQATATDSTVAGGNTNLAAALGSVVGGGASNSASGGNYATIGGGNTNQASALNATVAGGDGNVANGINSTISGGHSATTRGITGMNAYAGGASNGDGEKQRGEYVLGADTTDDTQTALTTDSDPSQTDINQIILPDSVTATYIVRGDVIAREAATEDTRAWEFKAVVKRPTNAASTAVLFQSVTSIYNDAGAAAWALVVSADTTNGGLQILGTGEAATTITWVAVVRTVEVTE